MIAGLSHPLYAEPVEFSGDVGHLVALVVQESYITMLHDTVYHLSGPVVCNDRIACKYPVIIISRCNAHELPN